MNAGIAQMLLETDRNDFRFENFCCAICSAEHGIELLPTSKTYDLGRDGRSGARSSRSHRNLLCATQSRDVDAKVEADLLRLTSTSGPEHLIYCCSQRLSEDGVDEVTKIVKRHIPGGSLTVYGSIQLGRLAEKHPEVFGKFYHAEVGSIRAVFERRPDEEESKKGLRLALVTIGAEGAADLKDALLRHAVLEVLSETKEASAARIAEEISKDLGLPVDYQDVVPIETKSTGFSFSSDPCKSRRDKSAPCKSIQPICTFAPLLPLRLPTELKMGTTC